MTTQVTINLQEMPPASSNVEVCATAPWSETPYYNFTLTEQPGNPATVSSSPFGGYQITAYLQSSALPSVISTSGLVLDWQVSVDGGKTWVAVGVTQNQVYLTWKNPTALTTGGGLPVPGGIAPYLTLLYVGCNAANDTAPADDDGVANQVFTKFETLDVTNANGTILKYYGSYAKPNPANPGVFETAGLIAHADGRCGAWMKFFIDVLRSQGVTTAQTAQIETAPYSYSSAAIVVKSLPVQGDTSDPSTVFWNHAVVLVGTTLYDPSYGQYYPPAATASALSEWDDASVSAIWYFDIAHNRTVVNHVLGTVDVYFAAIGGY
jgi:hypothetical protein